MQNQQFRILLVDDDANERSGVRFLIERGGFPLEISEASNGKRALEQLRRQSADILFTDVKMPYMDGLELSAAVCREFPQTKIIVFSAYGEFEYAKKAMEAKAVNYLLKPVNIGEFESVLGSVIQKCREEAALKQKMVTADRKTQWVRLLMGTQQDQQLLEEMEEKPLLLMHLESQNAFFANFEQDILKVLEKKTGGNFEYINLYPNSSYVVLFAPVSREKLEGICGELVNMAVEQGDSLSILVDDSAFLARDLAAHTQKVEQMRRQMFVAEGSVLYLAGLTFGTGDGFSLVEQRWNRTRDAIATESKAEIEKCVLDLLDAMTRQGLFSAAYIYHIFCDLFGKLYTQYGYTDNQAMRIAMRKLSGCRSKQALIQLTRSVLEDATRQTSGEQDASYVVQKVKRIIRKEFSQDLSLEYLAGSVGLVPSYLSYVFKRETGENIIKYLTDYRIEQARQMLDSGSYKISQVAKMCGYENPSYFNRLFKNAYGITPSQYKERNCGK